MWGLALRSVSADITFPRALSDWLIFLLSSNLCPVAWVTRTLSLPAKSTRLSLPTLIYFGPSSYWPVSSVIYSTMIINTACDLDERSFILVVAVALHWAPFCISAYTSLGDLTAHSLRPSTNTPFFLSSLIYNELLSFLSKSAMISL